MCGAIYLTSLKYVRSSDEGILNCRKAEGKRIMNNVIENRNAKVFKLLLWFLNTLLSNHSLHFVFFSFIQRRFIKNFAVHGFFIYILLLIIDRIIYVEIKYILFLFQLSCRQNLKSKRNCRCEESLSKNKNYYNQ